MIVVRQWIMARSASRVGKESNLWLCLLYYPQKCFKLRYLISLFIVLILFTYVRIIHQAPSDQSMPDNTRIPITIPNDITIRPYSASDRCNSDQIDSILKYSPIQNDNPDDQRPKPSIERLNKLFQILLSQEKKYRSIFDALNIFQFTDISNTLHPFTDDHQHFQTIHCLFQRYIAVNQSGQIDIQPELIFYLQQISKYLSDGFRMEHTNWKNIPRETIPQPVIILAANGRFYDTLQSSMKTVNEHLQNYSIAIYDLGFAPHQLAMVRSIDREVFICIMCVLDQRELSTLYDYSISICSCSIDCTSCEKFRKFRLETDCYSS